MSHEDVTDPLGGRFRYTHMRLMHFGLNNDLRDALGVGNTVGPGTLGQALRFSLQGQLERIKIALEDSLLRDGSSEEAR